MLYAVLFLDFEYVFKIAAATVDSSKIFGISPVRDIVVSSGVWVSGEVNFFE